MLSNRVVRPGEVETAELPSPSPSPREALIQVEATSVNRGELTLVGIRPIGWAPGQDVAGTVKVAAADGSGPRVGTRVAGLAEEGAWSEQVLVTASRLAVIPDDVRFATAGALPMTGLTALRTVRLLGSVLGRRVLVTGASGGVGRLQVQLLRLSGAEVVALASSPVPGAHVTISDISRSGRVDAALDAVGGDVLTGTIAALRPNAILVWFGNSTGERTGVSLLDFIGHEGARLVTYFSYAADAGQDAADLRFLLDLISTGRLEVGVAAEFVLSAAQEAMRRLSERGVAGKVVLVPGSS